MTPDFQIIANNKDITAAIRDRLLSLKITDEAGVKSDVVEIKLDDRDGAIQIPATGASLQVAIGYKQSGLVTMGKYTVDEISVASPPRSLTIKAHAADMRKSLKAKKSRSWHEKNIGAIVTSIAQSHGLEAKVSPWFAQIKIAHIDQANESDLHFLTRVARQYDAIAKPAFGYFLFVEKGKAKSVTGKKLPAISLSGRDLSSWQMTAADRNKYQAVIAHWQDKDKAKRIPEKAGTGEPIYTLRGSYPDQAQAQDAARAKLEALKRGKANLSASMMGRPEILAESKLNLTGVRAGVDGDWVITKVDHNLNQSGYSCRIEAETPTK